MSERTQAMSPRAYRALAIALVLGLLGSLAFALGASAAELPYPSTDGAYVLCSVAAWNHTGATAQVGFVCDYSTATGHGTDGWGAPTNVNVYYYMDTDTVAHQGPYSAQPTSWTCNTTTKQCTGTMTATFGLGNGANPRIASFDLSLIVPASGHNYAIWNGLGIKPVKWYEGTVTNTGTAYSTDNYPSPPPDWFADNPAVTTTSTTTAPTTTTTTTPPPGNGGATDTGCDAGPLGSIPLIGGVLDSVSGMVCGLTNLALNLFIPSSDTAYALTHLWDAITTHAPFSVIHDTLAFLPNSVNAFVAGLQDDTYDAGNRRCPSIADMSHGNLTGAGTSSCLLPLDADTATGADLALLRGILLFLFVSSTAVAVIKTTMRIANGGG